MSRAVHNLEKENKEAAVLLGFFERLKKELPSRISFLQLRPKRLTSAADNFQGDFDYLIRKKDLPVLLDWVYEQCKNSGINFEFQQKFRNKKKFIFFISEELSLTLEFWVNIEFTSGGITRYFSGESIFKSFSSGVNKHEILALIYITHLYHKQKNVFSAENSFRFSEFKKAFFNKDISESVRILQELQKKEISLEAANERAITALKSHGIRDNRNDFLKLKFIAERVWIKLFYLHQTVPVVGPDGVGKGIVSENTITIMPKWTSFRFKDLYRMRIFYKHLVLRFFSRKDEPKNKLDERIGYYIFFVALASIRTLPVYLWRKKVLLDRYYLDYYATPIRYLEGNQEPKKMRLYKLMLFLTPVPMKMVFMGCRDESLQERKNELPMVSVHYLQDLYIEFILAKKIPRMLFLSTENPIDISTKGMKAFIE